MDIQLEVRGLKTYFFGRRGVTHAVDEVSFSVGKGETVGIVGESGCGKSVTGLSIMGLVPPPGRIISGDIIFEGRSLPDLTEKQMERVRGREISMVFQDPMTSLNPVLNIEAQLTEGLRFHLGLRGSLARERALELLEAAGIADPSRRLKEYPHQLSGGMRQRIMIAMALACNPKLLIADEPTTALDVTIQAQILELLASLRAESDMSMILITHDLGIVAGATDKVIVMYAGKIVEQAPTLDLFEDPRHPYTRALLASIPSLDGERRHRLENIPGMPPSLLEVDDSCRFRQRCSVSGPDCTQEAPLERCSGSPEHWVACRRTYASMKVI